MSNSGDKVEQPERLAFQRLETAIEEVLWRLERARGRAEAAEEKSAEFQELAKRFSEDGGAAGQLLTRLRTLETENEELRRRMEQGREGVERLLAQIRFLEGQR